MSFYDYIDDRTDRNDIAGMFCHSDGPQFDIRVLLHKLIWRRSSKYPNIIRVPVSPPALQLVASSRGEILSWIT
ncbi:hypothetical protein F2P81_026258 [Scophthalmus maximus]|uniref:Uncharacterized protein n=1 Tax=Scophthalmus maximus TaxID=52904 RepID=A0A6A4RQ39_SCOMX|nr:hypothetical protein F2P81_026258 [Scophthalmus maximus]